MRRAISAGRSDWKRRGCTSSMACLGLKTHSKIALVVRKEGEGVRRYVHLATGNYNGITAQVYTDLGLFTCDERHRRGCH